MGATSKSAIGGGGPAGDGGPADVALADVVVRRDGRSLVDGVSLAVHRDRPMVLLGPNGAGKTTLLRLMATRLFPTSGSVRVLGVEFGHGDLRPLRSRIGFSSVAMDPLLPANQSVIDLVAAARHGHLRRDHRITGAPDREAAVDALARIGVADLADRRARTCSQGEWQRVQIARALVAGPDLVLLDEPCAGLDLGAREHLLDDLATLMAAPDAPVTVLVTHHLSEIPVGVTDATLVRAGKVVATGVIDDVLVAEAVSATFGLAVTVQRDGQRFAARRAVRA